MMKTVALFLGVAFAVGCSSSGDIGRLRDAKERVCSCKDIECKMEAAKELKDLAEKLAAKKDELSAEQRTEAATIMREMVDCAQNGRR